MTIKKKLVIIGTSDLAQIAYEYFTHDSNYEVVGFSIDAEFIKEDKLFGLPIVPFNDVETIFPPKDHEAFVAVVYLQLNRLRRRFFNECKAKGYKLANYISSKAFCWRNVELGENVFVFEDNTIQPFVKIGDNVILWSGNHIGHHSTIEDNVFVSSHVVISGHCVIGQNSFLGVNSTIADGITIAADNFIGLGAIINANTEENKLYTSPPAQASTVPAKRFFRVKE